MIRETLSGADEAFDDGEDVGWAIQSAFLRMRLLLEGLGLTEALKQLLQTEAEAKQNLRKSTFSPELGQPHLVWSTYLWRYVLAIETAYGESNGGTVTKDVIEILRQTLYSITDTGCFGTLPMNESDVHIRIEAVLRCVFPQLIHKPKITKQIKHFEPDTGIPSLRTLIEYKFISSVADARRISDEVLADTRGYVSKEWDRFIYVIYETKRIKPEQQWTQLLLTTGVDSNTTIIVLSGEQPFQLKRSAGARPDRTLTPKGRRASTPTTDSTGP